MPVGWPDAGGDEVLPPVRSMLDEDGLAARVMDGLADRLHRLPPLHDGFAAWIVVAGDVTPRRLGRLQAAAAG